MIEKKITISVSFFYIEKNVNKPKSFPIFNFNIKTIYSHLTPVWTKEMNCTDKTNLIWINLSWYDFCWKWETHNEIFLCLRTICWIPSMKFKWLLYWKKWHWVKFGKLGVQVKIVVWFKFWLLDWDNEYGLIWIWRISWFDSNLNTNFW